MTTIILSYEEPVGQRINSMLDTIDELLAKANDPSGINEFGADDMRHLDTLACRAQLVASKIEARDQPKVRSFRR